MTREQKIEVKKTDLATAAKARSNDEKKALKAGSVEVVGLIFKKNGKVYKFNPNGNKYVAGDVLVVTDYSKHNHIAAVAVENTKVDAATIVGELRCVSGEAIKVEVKEVKAAKPAKAVKAEKVVEAKEEKAAPVKEEAPVAEEAEAKGATFEDKINELEPEAKEGYEGIKNALLALGLTSKMTKDKETFSLKKEKAAVIRLTTKQVSLYLAIEAATYADSKFKGEDVSDKKAYADTPFLYKAGTSRKNKWALELIEDFASKKNLK